MVALAGPESVTPFGSARAADYKKAIALPGIRKQKLNYYMKKTLFFLLIGWSSLQAQTPVEQALEEIMTRYDAVGLSVAVVKKGKPVYEAALGVKNLETREPLRSTDLFRIASISKSFTATAILQLQEAGKLSLDDDISQYTGFPVRNPKFPQVPVTLRMMLSHTSSLNDSQGYFELSVIDPSINSEWTKSFNDYAPGEGYQYCNLNFNMLGAVVEKVSGERFDQYIYDHILSPLGLYGGYRVGALDSTRFARIYAYDQSYKESPGAYHPRTEELRQYKPGFSTPVFSPTGGMKISAPDLARYMIMHMNYGKAGKHRIISKKSAKLMQTPVKQGYGLALLKTEKLIPGVELTGHTGSAYGLYSSMFFDPAQKYGIVAITNGCKDCLDSPHNKLLQEVTRLLYTGFIAK